LHPGAFLKFTREQAAVNTVRKVGQGSITIGGRVFESNIGLTAGSIIENWPPCPIDDLDEQAIQAILETKPELLLLGTGWRARIPPRELVFAMARRGIGIEFMDTPAACRTFNILVGEGREAAAILYMNDG
jgi:uncharacterized protein